MPRGGNVICCHLSSILFLTPKGQNRFTTSHSSCVMCQSTTIQNAPPPPPPKPPPENPPPPPNPPPPKPDPPELALGADTKT